MGTRRWQKENEEVRERQASDASAKLHEQKAALVLAETDAHLETPSRARRIQAAELAGSKKVGET